MGLLDFKMLARALGSKMSPGGADLVIPHMKDFGPGPLLKPLVRILGSQKIMRQQDD